MLGTRFELRFVVPEGVDPTELSAAAFAAARDVEAIASAWEPGSELSELNRALAAREPFEASASLADLLRRCVEAARASDGAFDVTVGAILAAHGYYGDPPTPAGAGGGPRRFRLEGRTVVPLDPGLRFDLGGVTKGHACERMAAVLAGGGATDFLLSAGASLLLARGDEPGGAGWEVSVDTGADEPELWRLRDEALATSGQLSEPFFPDGRLASHVIDPRTGDPIDHRTLRVVVRARSPVDADLASTALLVLGSQAADASWPRLSATEALLVDLPDRQDGPPLVRRLR